MVKTRHVVTAAASAACLIAALMLGTAPASATYPGLNGRLAFGMALGANVEIFSVLPNGHDLSQLTDRPGFNACANYSSNGRSISWCGAGGPGVSEIWAMKANGKHQHQVTHTGGFLTSAPACPRFGS